LTPLKEGDIRTFTAYFTDQFDKKTLSLTGGSLNVVTEDFSGWVESQNGIQPGSGSGIGVPFHIVGGTMQLNWVFLISDTGQSEVKIQKDTMKLHPFDLIIEGS
jgi:hypothetical protein